MHYEMREFFVRKREFGLGMGREWECKSIILGMGMGIATWDWEWEGTGIKNPILNTYLSLSVLDVDRHH